MARFLGLTNATGKLIYVNVDSVCFIEQTTSAYGKSDIHFEWSEEGLVLTVQESPSDVMTQYLNTFGAVT